MIASFENFLLLEKASPQDRAYTVESIDKCLREYAERAKRTIEREGKDYPDRIEEFTANAKYNIDRVTKEWKWFETDVLDGLNELLKPWGFQITSCTSTNRTGGGSEDVIGKWEIEGEDGRYGEKALGDVVRGELRLKFVGRRKLLKFDGYTKSGSGRASEKTKKITDAIDDEVRKKFPIVLQINHYSLVAHRSGEIQTNPEPVIADIWLYHSRRGEMLSKDIGIGEAARLVS